MTILTPEFLAWSSREIHRTAEVHWRKHGTAPIKVVLFAADGAPGLVDFEQGVGQAAAGAAVCAHAARIGAVAVAMTAMGRIVDVLIEAPLAAAPGALPGLPAGARVVGEVTRSVTTLSVWPDRHLVVALRSDIRTGTDGAVVLAPMIESSLVDSSQAAGLVSWLTGLLPASGRKSSS